MKKLILLLGLSAASCALAAEHTIFIPKYSLQALPKRLASRTDSLESIQSHPERSQTGTSQVIYHNKRLRLLSLNVRALLDHRTDFFNMIQEGQNNSLFALHISSGAFFRKTELAGDSTAIGPVVPVEVSQIQNLENDLNSLLRDHAQALKAILQDREDLLIILQKKGLSFTYGLTPAKEIKDLIESIEDELSQRPSAINVIADMPQEQLSPALTVPHLAQKQIRQKRDCFIQ